MPMKKDTVRVRDIVTRTPTSSGNPRYIINTGLGAWYTMPDQASINEIDPNYTGRAILTINSYGYVTALEPVK